MMNDFAEHLTEDTQDVTCAHCGRDLSKTTRSRLFPHRYSSAHETIVAWSCRGRCEVEVEFLRRVDGILEQAMVDAHRRAPLDVIPRQRRG